ncbi:MAG: hypothetical protein HY077_14100 [Elusimicrobia bacterium]|nr:hypothetical protein [Elusimicrobiota bacterium]
MRRDLKRLVSGLAACKLGALAFVAALPWLWPGSFNFGNFQANFHWPLDAAPSFASLFRTWDAQHFLYLSQNGYQPGALSNNFYPLWPLLILAGALPFGSHLISGLVLSNVLSLAALILFFIFVKEARDEKTAVWSLFLLLAYPGAFFLCLPFSESLFFLLVMLVFFGFLRGQFGLSAVAAFFLPLARPQGILVAPAYWFCLWKRDKVKLADLSLWLSPLAGVAAYLLFMLHATGDAFEGFKAYRDIFPDSPSALRLLDPVGFAATFFHVTAWHGTSGSLMERLLFVMFLCCLPALWKRDRLLFLYALPMGLVPAISLSLVSYTRHLLLVFPAFIAVAGFLERFPPSLRWAVLSGSAVFQLYLLARHANNFWVA